MRKSGLILAVSLIFGLSLAGCENSVKPTQSKNENIDYEIGLMEASARFDRNTPPPSPLVTVNSGDQSLDFWPYTGTNFSGEPQDPINIIFIGETDPRDIRAALLALDGDRSAYGLPPLPPFNSTWDDAIGDIQTGYGEPDGWTGSTIQLSCGDYSQPRFHVRLFKVGQWTVANAHFEILIPGTADHQVLSWELAEQFVVVDFVRSGLLDEEYPIALTDQINASPFRAIPDFIYNELPTELRQLIGGPLGDITGETPILTDGKASILNLALKVPRLAETRVKDFIINYDQVFPRPFCSSGPDDYVYVQGPVQMSMTVNISPCGTYTMSFNAKGTLGVTAVNPMTGEPIGETLTAGVRQRHHSIFTDQYNAASGLLYQRVLPYTEPGSGRLFTWLKVSSSGGNGYIADIWCGDTEYPSPATNKEAGGISLAGLSPENAERLLR
jgi:hypothetical protein